MFVNHAVFDDNFERLFMQIETIYTSMCVSVSIYVIVYMFTRKHYYSQTNTLT